MASWSFLEDTHHAYLLALHDGILEECERIEGAQREERVVRRRETVDEMAARMRPELSEHEREAWIESRR